MDFGSTFDISSYIGLSGDHHLMILEKPSYDYDSLYVRVHLIDPILHYEQTIKLKINSFVPEDYAVSKNKIMLRFKDQVQLYYRCLS